MGERQRERKREGHGGKDKGACGGKVYIKWEI